MLTKKEFTQKYSECVSSLKNIKSSNDYINKSFDRASLKQIVSLMDREKESIREQLVKVEQRVQQMTKSYLDPDSIRKINILRDQLFIQLKRRRQFEIKISASKEEEQKQRKKGSKKVKSKVHEDNKENIVEKAFQDLQNKYEGEHIKLRSKQIAEVEKKLNNINQIIKQSGMLLEKGGQKVDIIEENMGKGQVRIQLANEQLKEANTKRKRKWFKYKIIGVILVGIGVFFTLFLLL